MFGLFKKKQVGNPKIPQISEIRLYYGLPRAGKSYCATDDILYNLRSNLKNSIDTYSNWPVYDKLSNEYTYRIDRKSMLNIGQDADIYIDEAHFWYNSRLALTKKGLTEDEMTFFRTVGHNNIRITLITHHPDRLDVIIRNIVHLFRHVQKKTWPLMERPRVFTIDDYLSESDMGGLMPKIAHQEIRWFNGSVANAYDTHQFKHLQPVKHKFYKWNEEEILKIPAGHGLIKKVGGDLDVQRNKETAEKSEA
jgi:hypothetical protein